MNGSDNNLPTEISPYKQVRDTQENTRLLPKEKTITESNHLNYFDILEPNQIR